MDYLSLWNSSGHNTGVGSPFPSPGDLPNPGIEPRSCALQADSLSAEPQRSCLILKKITKEEVCNLCEHKIVISYKNLKVDCVDFLNGCVLHSHDSLGESKRS